MVKLKSQFKVKLCRSSEPSLSYPVLPTIVVRTISLENINTNTDMNENNDTEKK